MNNTYADNEYDLMKAWTKPEYFTMPQLYSTDKERRTIDAWTRAFFSVPQPVQNMMIDELKMTYTYTLPALNYIHLEASIPNKTYRIQGTDQNDARWWWCVPIDGKYGSSCELYQTNDINQAYHERNAREQICLIKDYLFQVVEYHGEE